jgi:hypothetical protein
MLAHWNHKLKIRHFKFTLDKTTQILSKMDLGHLFYWEWAIPSWSDPPTTLRQGVFEQSVSFRRSY